jgi:hypothetical protein
MDGGRAESEPQFEGVLGDSLEGARVVVWWGGGVANVDE